MAALLIGASLTGCSSTSSMNPINWWHRQEGGKIAQERPAPPGADEAYPNLATVPGKPEAPDKDAMKKLTDSLIADRTNAQHAAQSAPLADPSSPSASPSLFGVGTAPPPPPAVTGASSSNGGPAAGPSAGNSSSGGASASPAASASFPAVTAPPAPATPPSAAPRKAVQSTPLPDAAPAPTTPAAPGTPSQPAPSASASGQAAALATQPSPAAAPSSAAQVAAASPATNAQPQPAQSQPALPPGPPPRPAAAGAPPPPAPVSVPAVPATGNNATTIVFVAGSSALSQPAADEVKAFAAKRGSRVISITGYGDSTSGDPAAQSAAVTLGLSRAQQIFTALRADGVPAEAIRVNAEASGRGAALRLLQ